MSGIHAMRNIHRPGKRQRGAALFVGLIIMLVLTILGITIMQVVTQQERMARNLVNKTIAFQAAETALRAGESEINSGAAPFSPFSYETFGACATTYFCLPTTGSTERWKQVSWAENSVNTARITTSLALPGSARQPRYLIELVSGKPTYDPSIGCTPAVLRITAVGFGPDSAESNLQTIYRFKPPAC